MHGYSVREMCKGEMSDVQLRKLDVRSPNVED